MSATPSRAEKPASSRDDESDGAPRVAGTGWKSVLHDIWKTLGEERVAMLAAAVAFFSFLSLPPGLTLFVSIYGLVADTEGVRGTIEALDPVLPDGASEILSNQLGAIAESSNPSLSLGVALSLVLGLWTSMRGIRALIIACNVVDGEGERRGIIALNRLALSLTAGLLVFGAGAFALVVLLPAVLTALPALESEATLASILRWPVLGAMMVVVLGALYRYAPNRSRFGIRWVTWGSIAATVLWLAASAVLSTFVMHFGRYNETYGALASVAVLLIWLYSSAWAVLLGAALNAALRRRAHRGSPTRAEGATDQEEPGGDSTRANRAAGGD